MSIHVDDQYFALVDRILSEGVKKPSRAGETIGVFGHTMTFDLREGFPLLTTKKINFEYVYYELMAFLRGETNIKGFEKCKKLWEDFADKETGDLGRIYGAQWTAWAKYDSVGQCRTSGDYTFIREEVDQIQILIDTLKTNPNDRRMIVTAWNPGELDQMALPPCHMMFQCYVSDGCLDLMMIQRSCDVAIGIPFNIASYSLLLSMLAEECHLQARNFTHVLGDAHIYAEHIEGIKTQLLRGKKEMPTLFLAEDIEFFERAKRDTSKDYELRDYKPAPFIKFSLNV